MTVVVHSFVADSRLLWFGVFCCCFLPPYACRLATVWVFDVVSAVLFLSFAVSCLRAWLGQPFFICHQHLWFGLSFFATGICVQSLPSMAFSAVGICVRLFAFALLALVSGYQCISQFLVSCCALAARQLHPWRFKLEFFQSRLPCGQPYKFCFEANPIWYPAIKFMKWHSEKRSLHKWAWLRRSLLNCTNLTHFRLTVGWFCRNSCIVMPFNTPADSSITEQLSGMLCFDYFIVLGVCKIFCLSVPPPPPPSTPFSLLSV